MSALQHETCGVASLLLAAWPASGVCGEYAGDLQGQAACGSSAAYSCGDTSMLLGSLRVLPQEKAQFVCKMSPQIRACPPAFRTCKQQCV